MWERFYNLEGDNEHGDVTSARYRCKVEKTFKGYQNKHLSYCRTRKVFIKMTKFNHTNVNIHQHEQIKPDIALSLAIAREIKKKWTVLHRPLMDFSESVYFSKSLGKLL